MPSEPILAGNWATLAVSVPALIAVHLVRAGVEADEDDFAGLDAGVLDRLDRAQGRRAAGGVDRRQVLVCGQHRLRSSRALRLVAVGLELRDDLDLAFIAPRPANMPVTRWTSAGMPGMPSRMPSVSPAFSFVARNLPARTPPL